MAKDLTSFLENVEDDKLLLEFLDVQKNKKDLVGWGIYIPEKEAVVIMGRPAEKNQVQKLLTQRKERGRRSEQLIPLFKPHAGLSLGSNE